MRRTTALEERLTRVEHQLTALRALSASSRRSARGGNRAERFSRAGFLRKAGAAVAGVAGAAVLETGGARDAYATTTDTNFVAGGIIGGGGIGFLAQPSANFDAGAHLAGSDAGLAAFGTGTIGAGVKATGAGGPAVGGVNAGVDAAGGIPNGMGIRAVGMGTAAGVLATGGASSGYGIQANGGAPDGTAVYAVGQGAGIGVYGTSASGVGLGGFFSGGRAPISLGRGPSAGPPTTGFHNIGDIWADSLVMLWICTAAGTPGSFVPLQPGGLGKSHFTAVSTSQYTQNSDGTTWKDLDATNLSLTITPLFNCQAILSTNADLWTTIAGFNQDIGIAISGGAYPTVAGQPEAWKESGGFAGTFSPNAAFLETTKRLVAGTTYTIKLVRKSNKAMPASAPDGGPSLIVAGAGPIPTGSNTFSPTRLAAQLIVDA